MRRDPAHSPELELEDAGVVAVLAVGVDEADADAGGGVGVVMLTSTLGTSGERLARRNLSGRALGNWP
jgi:hypothetical protein